jgi:hypothetical protein
MATVLDRTRAAADDHLLGLRVARGGATRVRLTAYSLLTIARAGDRARLHCLREAVADDDEARIRAALALVLASRHLRNLRRLESDLARLAAALAEERV